MIKAIVRKKKTSHLCDESSVSKKTITTSRYRLFYSSVLVIIITFGFGCAGNLKQRLVAEGGSIGVRKACEKVGIQGCPDLGDGFKAFIYTDKKKAAEHIANMIAANPNINITVMTNVMDAAAKLAGPQAAQLREFTAFLVNVEKSKKNHPVVNSSNAGSPIVAKTGAEETMCGTRPCNGNGIADTGDNGQCCPRREYPISHDHPRA